MPDGPSLNVESAASTRGSPTWVVPPPRGFAIRVQPSREAVIRRVFALTETLDVLAFEPVNGTAGSRELGARAAPERD